MSSKPITEPVLAPELEALARAADQRLRADLDGNAGDIRERDQAVLHAASASIAAGMPLGAVSHAEQIGQARARRELGGELLRRVERTARRSRDATAQYEQTVARAVRLGLPYRDIATAAQIAHGTIRSIITRTNELAAAGDEPTESLDSASSGEDCNEQHDS